MMALRVKGLGPIPTPSCPSANIMLESVFFEAPEDHRFIESLQQESMHYLHTEPVSCPAGTRSR